jgi:hypothetical protein
MSEPTAAREEESSNGAWQAPVAAIASVPKVIGMLGDALEDIRAIARGMQLLPEIARILETIERRVESLDDEVRQMRRAVESMGADVKGLDPRLEGVQDSLRPLHRLGSRLRRAPVEEDQRD